MKTVFKAIGAFILGAVGIFLLTRKSNDNKEKIAEVDKAIEEKEEAVVKVQQEADVIEKKRKKRKKNINHSKAKAANLETQKQNIKPKAPATAQEAKADILSKTNRGRKPKKA